MRLLRVSAENFKNAANGVIIDLVPQARKSDEDKFYEMNEIAHGLFVYSTGAFIGKNASGKQQHWIFWIVHILFLENIDLKVNTIPAMGHVWKSFSIMRDIYIAIELYCILKVIL